MYYDWKVKIPEVKGKIYEKTINGTVYINYEYDRVYKPEKKYNIPKRTTIGKKCEDDPDMMYPNPNFLKYFLDANLPEGKRHDARSSCLCIGTYPVIEKLMADSSVNQIISSLFHDDRSFRLCQDLASYYLLTETDLGQHYPDYTFRHPLYTLNYTISADKAATSFISRITGKESTAFLEKWNSSKDKEEKVYISYCSATGPSRPGDIQFIGAGQTGPVTAVPVFGCSVAYGRNNSEPLFYAVYPGAVIGIPQLQSMLEKAVVYDYKDLGFILDRGCFDSETIPFMDKHGYDFMILTRGGLSFTRDIVQEVQDSFEDNACYCYELYGCRINCMTRKIPVFSSDEKDRYVHIYYSSDKAEQERAAFLSMPAGIRDGLVADPEKYLKMSGWFCIITSAEMTAEDALKLYLNRVVSDQLFNAEKHFLDDRDIPPCTAASAAEAIDGRMFIAFIALILRNRMYTELTTAAGQMSEKPAFTSIYSCMRELEKIEMIRQPDGTYRLDRAVTGTQETILKAFGLDADHIKRKAREISEKLKSQTSKIKDSPVQPE